MALSGFGKNVSRCPETVFPYQLFLQEVALNLPNYHFKSIVRGFEKKYYRFVYQTFVIFYS